MLKNAEIRVYKDKAIERFKEVFTGFDPPKIVVVPTFKRQAVIWQLSLAIQMFPMNVLPKAQSM